MCVPSIAPAHRGNFHSSANPFNTDFKASPVGHLMTFGTSTSTTALHTSLTIWQAVLLPISNHQPKDLMSSPVAQCHKQTATHFSTAMALRNLVSFLCKASFNSPQIARKQFLDIRKFSIQRLSSTHWLAVISQNKFWPLLGSCQNLLSTIS